MKAQSNPTAMSAVVGQDLEISTGPGRVAAFRKALIFPILILALAAYLFVGIAVMRVPENATFPGPRLFPAIVAAALTVFAVLMIVQAVRERASAPPTQAVSVVEGEAAIAAAAETAPERVRLDWISLAWVVGTFAVFAITLNILGWLIGATLLFVGVARGLGEKRWLLTAFVGLTVAAFSYIAFDMGLGMQLPSGLVGWEF